MDKPIFLRGSLVCELCKIFMLHRSNILIYKTSLRGLFPLYDEACFIAIALGDLELGKKLWLNCLDNVQLADMPFWLEFICSSCPRTLRSMLELPEEADAHLLHHA